MPPSDREFDMIRADLAEVKTGLAEIKQVLAERRGVERALRYVFGGGLATLAISTIALWDRIRGAQ